MEAYLKIKLQALSGSDTQYCKSGDHIKTKKWITTNSSLSFISTISTKVTKKNYDNAKKNFFGTSMSKEHPNQSGLKFWTQAI